MPHPEHSLQLLLQYLSKNIIALELRSRAASIISFEMCHRERLKEFSLVQYKKRLCNKLIEVAGLLTSYQPRCENRKSQKNKAY